MSDNVPKIDLGLLFSHSVAYIQKFPVVSARLIAYCFCGRCLTNAHNITLINANLEMA